jgi:hypothetical protein
MTEQKRPLKRGFAHKTSLSLAIDKAILMSMIDSPKVYDPLESLVSHGLPAGGYVALAARLRYERDVHRARLAMTGAPIHDTSAMLRRWEWMRPDNLNEPQPSVA